MCLDTSTVACRKTGLFGKLLCKWGHFERAKTTLKMLLASWFLVCFFKRFRCLNAENLGSVGQRAAKLLAVKVGGLKKKSAGRPRPQSASLLGFDSRSRSNHSESLMAGNFAAHWPTDPKFSALKHLNFLKKHTKNQEASSILRVVFTLSKWPHLHREWPKKRVFLQGTVVIECPLRESRIMIGTRICVFWVNNSM